MIDVSEKFLQLSKASTRQVGTRILIYDHIKSTKTWKYVTAYTESDGIISWDITGGQQTGTFRIGKTICKSLEITLTKNTVIGSNSKIIVQVRVINPADLTDTSEWIKLGTFYVDTISISENKQTKKIVAADRMLTLEKSYRSKKGFPMLMSDMLGEVAGLAGFEVAENVNYINDPPIVVFPYQGQSNSGGRVLYSRRRIVGFVASILGSNAYFSRDDKLTFTDYSKNTVQIDTQKCFKLKFSGYDYDISDVIWAEKGESSASDDDDSYMKIYFENPLDVGSADKKMKITDKLKAVLVGKNLRQISIEKQGTGLYEIGETVTVADSSGMFDIIICGIKYSMSNNGFKETIFSVASSESESNYDDTSSGSYGTSGSSTAILYQVSDTTVTLSEEYKEIFKMQFGSQTNSPAIAAVTLAANVSNGGNITVGFFVDTRLYEEFTDLSVNGHKIISIIYPLVNLPGGGHNLSVRIKGTAEALFPVMRSYLTLIANGVSSSGGFDGTLQLKDTIEDVIMSDENGLIIGEFSAELNSQLLTPIGGTVKISVDNVMLTDDDKFTISKVNETIGGVGECRFLDSQGRTFMTSDGKRLITKQFILRG